jgi:uncharacterized protein
MTTTSRQGQKSQSAADALAVNVAGLLGEPAGTTHDIEISSPALDLGPDLRQSRGIRGRLRLSRTNRGLLVKGRLFTSLALVCSRCLRDLDYPVEMEIEEEALPTIDLASGMPLDTTAEPDALRLTDHHELALEEAVRDAILLTEPIAPLCREDCPGLCVICGEELGSGPHDHPDAEIDPRLEALRGFGLSKDA